MIKTNLKTSRWFPAETLTGGAWPAASPVTGSGQAGRRQRAARKIFLLFLPYAPCPMPYALWLEPYTPWLRPLSDEIR